MKTPKPPDDLADAILRATSGPVCGSSRTRLAGWVDGALDPVDGELVSAHVARCRQCASLAAALRALEGDLPLLAEMDPGPGFTEAVLAATAGRRRPALAARLAEIWQSLLTRPRFAWEGAYVGALALVLIFGTSGSPLASIPRRALELAATNPVEELREPVSRLEESVGSEVREAWSATRGKVLTTSRRVAVRIRGGFTELLTAIDRGNEDGGAPDGVGREPEQPGSRPSLGEGRDQSDDDTKDRSRQGRSRPEGDKR